MRTVISKDQFEVFLMVYAAFADFETLPLEENFIIDKYGDLRYREALKTYQSLTEYERVQTLIDHFEDFKDVEKAEQIKSDLKTLLDFDGYNRFEQSFYDYLDSIIKSIND